MNISVRAAISAYLFVVSLFSLSLSAGVAASTLAAIEAAAMTASAAAAICPRTPW